MISLHYSSIFLNERTTKDNINQFFEILFKRSSYKFAGVIQGIAILFISKFCKLKNKSFRFV